MKIQEIQYDAHSIYQEIKPPKAFSDRIIFLWSQKITGRGTYHHPVLPDGCTDIIWTDQFNTIVVGPATTSVVVDLPAGAFLTGIRFRPGWASSSLGLPTEEIRNQEIPLEAIWQKDFLNVTEKLHVEKSLEERLMALSNSLSMLCLDRLPTDPRIDFCIQWLINNPTGQVKQLAELLNLSERQLQRLFCLTVGYPPKLFQRIIRIQRLIKNSDLSSSLASRAIDEGFSDQAHMCREVQAIANCTPKALFEKRFFSTVSDLFNT